LYDYVAQRGVYSNQQPDDFGRSSLTSGRLSSFVYLCSLHVYGLLFYIAICLVYGMNTGVRINNKLAIAVLVKSFTSLEYTRQHGAPAAWLLAKLLTTSEHHANAMIPPVPRMLHTTSQVPSMTVRARQLAMAHHVYGGMAVLTRALPC
jgi:hypothetical protein